MREADIDRPPRWRQIWTRSLWFLDTRTGNEAPMKRDADGDTDGDGARTAARPPQTATDRHRSPQTATLKGSRYKLLVASSALKQK